jgi:nicotinate-nucleotide--dimethylbenzimidazole phosphoribosyltransferase
MSVLAAVGGFEIAAIVGLILGAAERRRVVVLDGFISCSAALVARALAPASLDYVIFSHCSAERGHRKMLEFLGAKPLLDLDMRLGEGTGAAIGINLLEAAVKLYREMATFESAGVSTAARSAEYPSAAAG